MVAVPSIGCAASPNPQRATREADATRQLYEQCARQIYAYCFHQLRNKEEAEDATQSTFLNAFRGLQRGVEPEFETAWIYKIAQNVCLTRQRSTSRRRRVELPGDLDAMQDVLPAREVDSHELIGLPEALNLMPEQQRRALLLREWQGLSYREIADELGLSQAAVETLLFRARRSLASGLAEEQTSALANRIQNGRDAGSLLALVKSLLVTGGAKVAAMVATVAATSAAVAGPAARHVVAVGLPFQVPPAKATVQSAADAGVPVATAPQIAEQVAHVAPHAAVVRIAAPRRPQQRAVSANVVVAHVGVSLLQAPLPREPSGRTLPVPPRAPAVVPASAAAPAPAPAPAPSPSPAPAPPPPAVEAQAAPAAPAAPTPPIVAAPIETVAVDTVPAPVAIPPDGAPPVADSGNGHGNGHGNSNGHSNAGPAALPGSAAIVETPPATAIAAPAPAAPDSDLSPDSSPGNGADKGDQGNVHGKKP